MIRSWRDEKRKSDIFAICDAAGVGGAGAGVYLGDYVQLAQLGTLLSLFQTAARWRPRPTRWREADCQPAIRRSRWRTSGSS